MLTVALAHFIWAPLVLAAAGLAAVGIKAYARHQLVKVTLRKVGQKRRAQVLTATALLLEERRRTLREPLWRRLWGTAK